jgi:hypothetical protein
VWNDCNPYSKDETSYNVQFQNILEEQEKINDFEGISTGKLQKPPRLT